MEYLPLVIKDEYTLDMDAVHSLAQFNSLLRDYVRRHNTTFHTGIQCTPFERFRATKDHPRAPQSADWLDECFLNRVCRKVIDPPCRGFRRHHK